MSQFAVAIDGPAGAGKSSIAKRVSAELGFMYVDTGTLYRAIGLFMKKQGVDITSEAAVCNRLLEITLKLEFHSGSQRVILNGTDVSDEIRTPEIAMYVSSISALQPVRDFLLELQRNIARGNQVIMDGRDIASVVLPNAQVKIYLTATSHERACRRMAEHEQRGEKVSFDELLAQIEKRDYNDSHRAVAPLMRVPEAVLLDTTGFTFEQSVEVVKKTITDALQAKQSKLI